MRKILEFFVKNSPFFVYLFYALISILLLVRFNPYHQSVYFSSANMAIGGVYSLTSNVTSYFGLKHINEGLMEQNAALEKEVQRLLSVLSEKQNIEIKESDTISRYNYIVGRVINSSTNNLKNYITLDKGTLDGVEVDMAVANQDGAVGLVSAVSDHYAVVLSILNTVSRTSVKVKDTDYFGSLVWDGVDSRYAVLEELPSHVEFSKGDTIVTSGYSNSYPEGILVGIVEDYNSSSRGGVISLKIRLEADFDRLKNVRIIEKTGLKEQLMLEKSAAGIN